MKRYSKSRAEQSNLFEIVMPRCSDTVNIPEHNMPYQCQPFEYTAK